MKAQAGEIITPEELERWAAIAARAIGITEIISVTQPEGEGPDLPAVDLGGEYVALVRVTKDDGSSVYLWYTNDEYYDTLIDALLMAASEAARSKAERALYDADLGENFTGYPAAEK